MTLNTGWSIDRRKYLMGNTNKEQEMLGWREIRKRISDNEEHCSSIYVLNKELCMEANLEPLKLI